MHFRTDRNHKIDFLFPMLVLLLFAACAVTVVLLAAGVYSRTVNDAAAGDDARTAISYLTERLHSYDTAGSAELGELGDCSALILTRTENGYAYRTYIYAYEGRLMELMAREDADVQPDAGRSILDVASLQMEEPAEGLYRFTTTDAEGNVNTAVVAVRSEEAQP